jgi:hypothetical protein
VDHIVKGARVSDPIDVFGIRTVVETGVEIAKAYLLPIAAAKGDKKADLIRLRGQLELMRERNQYAVLELAEHKLRNRGEVPQPLKPSVLLPLLEAVAFIEDSGLRDLWAELLAGHSASNFSEQEISVHTALLRQITPYDAALLDMIFATGVLGDSARSSPAMHIEERLSDQAGSSTMRFKADWSPHGRVGPDIVVDKLLPLGDLGGAKSIWFALSNLDRSGILRVNGGQYVDANATVCEFEITDCGRSFLSAVGILPGAANTICDEK